MPQPLSAAGSGPARNAPCPCGSGRRYKDCHGALAGGAPDAVSADQPEALLRQAVQAFARGDPKTALALLERSSSILSTQTRCSIS